MWALCPPSYHDNDMPIDLRKKVVLQRELKERQEYYHRSEEIYAPKDYSVRDNWQQQKVFQVGNLYPSSERYEVKCSILEPDNNREKPQDLRPIIRGTLETAIKKLHNTNKQKQVLDIERDQRCKSAEALFEKENANKKLSRSSSCPDLTSIENKLSLSHQMFSHSLNDSDTLEVKNYTQYTSYSPDHEDVSSPVIGGAKKRKSFVPLYGDRAPIYERINRSPSPQNLVCSKRGYYSPSPKKPIYIHNGYHSPSPEHRIYHERIYRSPSPKRSIYTDRRYYPPSPTRPTYDERNYNSPSPQRPIYGERCFRSPSPKRRPKSPTEHPPYEEYFSHPEILLRRQLGHQNTSPYFLHVYDYYQHLVQRLREQSSPTARINSPVSPTPTEEDSHVDAQRKRPCRALTGKHVRQGTGASLSTLLTLRQKIQERQKAKEHQPRTALNGINNKNAAVKKNNPKKVKPNTKGPLGKIQNC